VDIDGVPDGDDELFNLTLQRVSPDSHLVIDQEMHRRVSFRDTSENFVGEALSSSSIARLESPHPTHRPESTRAKGNRYDTAYIGHTQSGTDGTELSDYDLVGSKEKATGLFALQGVEHFDVLYLPPTGKDAETGPTALLAAELFCRERGAMLIADPRATWMTAEDAVHGVRDTGLASPNILAYFPRVRRRIEKGGRHRVAGGAIAGLLCKLDRTYGPWQEMDQQGLGFSRKLIPSCEIDEEDLEQLTRSGINAILPGVAGKARINGSVTLARGSEDYGMFRKLPVRRLCLRVVTMVDHATRWAVFEEHDADLALRISGQIRAALQSLFDLGAFESDRFVVQCDAGLARRDNEFEHGVTILLGFQPSGCGQPVLITLHQTAHGCRVASTAFAPVELT
jgi:hypothetical protein